MQLDFHNRKRGSFEQLEVRQMLAGNVQVQLLGGELLVQGDNQPNSFLMERIDNDSIRITGIGTRINGSFSAKRFDGIVGDIGINMKGGSDIITLKNVYAPSDLGILLGGGSDALVMTGVKVRDACGIDAGTEHDAITIDKGTFSRDLGIKTRSGSDALAISRSNITGALSIQMDAGNDALSMLNVNVIEPAIDMLDVEEEEPNPWAAFDILDAAFFDIYCGAQIVTGTGHDAVSLVKVYVDCFAAIDTKSGNDSVAINTARFGQLEEFFGGGGGGGGIMASGLSESFPIGLCIQTDVGNDAVAVANATVYGEMLVDTTGEICCLVEGEFLVESAEERPSSPDGIDAVSLLNVDVKTAFVELPPEENPGLVNGVSEGGFGCGDLLVFTGNNADSIALNLVDVDGIGLILASDESNLDGNDAVSIANSNFGLKLTDLMPETEALLSSLGEESISLLVFTGAGSDAVAIASVHATAGSVIITGSIFDIFEEEQVPGPADGNDRVAINALTADLIFVALGDGDFDALAISSSKAEEAFFDGGKGKYDTLTRFNNQFEFEEYINFEFVV